MRIEVNNQRVVPVAPMPCPLVDTDMPDPALCLLRGLNHSVQQRIIRECLGICVGRICLLSVGADFTVSAPTLVGYLPVNRRTPPVLRTTAPTSH